VASCPCAWARPVRPEDHDPSAARNPSDERQLRRGYEGVVSAGSIHGGSEQRSLPCCLGARTNVANGGLIPSLRRWPHASVTTRLFDVSDLVKMLIESESKEAA